MKIFHTGKATYKSNLNLKPHHSSCAHNIISVCVYRGRLCRRHHTAAVRKINIILYAARCDVDDE